MIRRPLCRVIVFGTLPIKGKPRPCAWDDWNPDPALERHMGSRLSGAGSFYHWSPRRAWRRARVLIARGAQQVKVETISGHGVGRLFAGGMAYALTPEDRR